MTAQTQLRSYSEQQRAFGHSNICNWGYLGFPAIKIIVICQVRIYCSLRVKINTCEMPHRVRRSWMHFVCICFHVRDRQKPEYPQLKLHGWRRHYTGRYRSSGISFLYLWLLYTFSHSVLKFMGHGSGMIQHLQEMHNLSSRILEVFKVNLRRRLMFMSNLFAFLFSP